MNISFLTSGHDPFDDRIFYHMARSLSDTNNNVQIVSSKKDLDEVISNIQLNCFSGDDFSKREKIERFIKPLAQFKPRVIICSEPLTIVAAKRYSRSQSGKIRIIYDITEWYPSKKNLLIYKPLIRWFIFLKLLAFNLRVSMMVDSFIFGEWYKSKPYRCLFPSKSFVYTSYYPDLKYIKYCTPSLMDKKLRLTYSGKITFEKGYGNFINVLNRLAENNEELQIEVKIIGWYESIPDQKVFENLLLTLHKNIHLTIMGRQKFENYINQIKYTDIFLDLRSDDFENQHCLPIKLFYYAALGRPVIFSNLKAIRKEVDIDKFGSLVKPTDIKQIVKIIENYLKNRELYSEYCANARSLSESEYNWGETRPVFLNFISSF
jgi:glycosyltransferase involved in cell wall biosynthesis